MADEDTRGRNWATIVYPESAPADWMQRFANLHVKGYISPLHDSDVNPLTGEVKKPHYHVMMQIPGKIAESGARKKFDSIGGVGCARVADWAAYARYLCHLDESNNGKARYNTGMVQMFGGADYFEDIETAKDQAELIAEMQIWCDETGCTLYSALSKYARENRRDWFRVLVTTRGVNVMKAYLQSIEYGARVAQ